MSSTQRATIVILVIVAVAIWGLGLRAVLQPSVRAEQESAIVSAVTEVTAEVTPTRTSSSTPTPTPSPEPTSISTIQVATPTVSPTATSSPTQVPSATMIATRQPAIIPSLTATSQQPKSMPSSSPVRTPVIPNEGRFLLVDQDEQVMHIYQDGTKIRSVPVSTGRPVENAFTPAWQGDVGRYWGSGPFLNTNLRSDYMWYLFQGARGSILIHSVPYTQDGDVKIYDQPDALGVEPTSHGCVRISPEDAQWLKNWDPVGVPIEITPWSGEIGPPDEAP